MDLRPINHQTLPRFSKPKVRANNFKVATREGPEQNNGGKPVIVAVTVWGGDSVLVDLERAPPKAYGFTELLPKDLVNETHQTLHLTGNRGDYPTFRGIGGSKASPKGIAQTLLSDRSSKLLRPFLARKLLNNLVVVFLRNGEGVTNGSFVR